MKYISLGLRGYLQLQRNTLNFWEDLRHVSDDISLQEQAIDSPLHTFHISAFSLDDTMKAYRDLEEM